MLLIKADNVPRAHRADMTMAYYADMSAYNGDREHDLADLLTDILHLCQQESINFERALASARMHHEAEK